jgi:hypothetical protein
MQADYIPSRLGLATGLSAAETAEQGRRMPAGDWQAERRAVRLPPCASRNSPLSPTRLVGSECRRNYIPYTDGAGSSPAGPSIGLLWSGPAEGP